MNEETLFHLVLAQPPGHRAAFLVEACPDPVLRRRVAVLVEAHQKVGDFLCQPPLADLGVAAPPPPAAVEAGAIGPYRLIHKLGEGGMGVVFLAEQTHPVSRQVAVKLLRQGHDSRQVIARFEAERQVLAAMDHPNIARVFDAGTTAEGRPYFVMELVQGVPITTYCDRHQLALDQRVELMLPVCRAIQHAHQRGIIHRDLKPSNVLVTQYDGAAVPKVIDFGVAKAADRQLDAATLATESGAVIGTLQYMSPEQAASQPAGVDTRSDIYSLGVLLYELLTGTPPIDRRRLQETPFLEVLRLIREDEPPRPSTRITVAADARPGTAAGLGARVAAELDWIVMKALEKEPDRRYETVSALATDLFHYLHDEPVAACPPSVAYRLHKFARKHRTRLQVAVGFLVLMVAATAVSVRLAIVAQRESTAKEAARVEAAGATVQALEALAALTDGMLERLMARQVQLTAADRQYLRDVLTRYERFAALKGDGTESRAIRAEGAFRVGLLRLRLEEHAAAQAAFRTALAGYRQLGEEFPDVPRYRLDTARTCTNLGLLAREAGRWDEAEALERTSLQITERLAQEFPDQPGYRQEVAGSHLNLASLWNTQGRSDRASGDLRMALGILEQLATAHPTAERQRDLAACLSNLGETLRHQGDGPGAVAANQRALDILSVVQRDVPDDPGYRQELARYHNNLATCLLETGAATAARDQATEALRIQTRLAAEFPTVPAYRVELARSHANSGVALGELDPDQAEAHFRAALAIQERLVADLPDLPGPQQDLAITHNGLGNLLHDRGQAREGDAALLAAVRTRERLVAAHPQVVLYAVELAGSCCNVANSLLERRHRPADARLWYDKAIDRLTAVLATQPGLAGARAFLRNSYEGRYQALRLLGHTDAALADVDRCLALSDERTGARVRLGRFEVLIGTDPARALVELQRATSAPDAPDATLRHGVELLCQVASQEDDDARREDYARQALALLGQLATRGYLRSAERREGLRSDPGLELLRGRAEFVALLRAAEELPAPQSQPARAR